MNYLNIFSDDFLYRISRWFYIHRIPFIPQIFQALIFLLFNSKVTANSEIGKGTYFVCKGISTVLIPGTRIGENCVLGLRFSTVRKSPYKNVPQLGNNVWCGPNVVIAGPVAVDDDVIIAANSFVDSTSKLAVGSSSTITLTFCKIMPASPTFCFCPSDKIEDNPKYKEGIMPYLMIKNE